MCDFPKNVRPKYAKYLSDLLAFFVWLLISSCWKDLLLWGVILRITFHVSLMSRLLFLIVLQKYCDLLFHNKRKRCFSAFYWLCRTTFLLSMFSFLCRSSLNCIIFLIWGGISGAAGRRTPLVTMGAQLFRFFKKLSLKIPIWFQTFCVKKLGSGYWYHPNINCKTCFDSGYFSTWMFWLLDYTLAYEYQL